MTLLNRLLRTSVSARVAVWALLALSIALVALSLAEAQTATAVAETPMVAPVPAAEQPTVPAIVTEAPLPAGASRVASQADSGSGAGGLNPSPLPHNVPVEGSLTVSAIGSVTVVPDELYVIVIPEVDYGLSDSEQLTREDRRDILENLVEMGVSEEAVAFEYLGRYEPPIVAVEVGIDEYKDVGDSIVEAIEKVVRRSESFGVRFSLSEENCDRALSLARREAVPEAEATADDLAEALGLERGEVIGALEYPLQRSGYGLPVAEPDACVGLDADPWSSPLLPFDSEPEVEISVGLQVSYGIIQRTLGN